jgi:Domain of unknown function (DUF4440)
MAFATVAQSAVLTTEQQRFTAMINRDTMFLKKHLHSDLRYIHSNALLEDKNQFIQAVKSGSIRYQHIQRDTATVVRYARTAVVSGRVRVNGLFKDQPFKVNLYYTAVYRRKNGQWQLLRWQSTRINDLHISNGSLEKG